MSNKNPSNSFKPGDPRINKDGRPKKGESWADLLDEVMEELTEDEKGNRIKLKRALAKQMAKQALKGNSKYMEMIMERMEGKAKQSVETNTAFTFNFEDESDEEI